MKIAVKIQKFTVNDRITMDEVDYFGITNLARYKNIKGSLRISISNFKTVKYHSGNCRKWRMT